jgi:hypothetical protein
VSIFTKILSTASFLYCIAVATRIKTNQNPKEGGGAVRRLSLLVFLAVKRVAALRAATRFLVLCPNKTGDSYIYSALCYQSQSQF